MSEIIIEDGILPVPQREEYYKRLSTPYTKCGEQKLFLEQFNAGGGNELAGKFWSTVSSSRLCFDLYSWMAGDEGYMDVEFEKKLRGIISGRKDTHPNMDVYFETEEGIFFIESKYTETVRNGSFKKHLPEAYWKRSERYRSARGANVTFPILDRYRRIQPVMDAFVRFIDQIDRAAASEDAPSWFDAKQETCHLLGIVFHAIENHPSKPIHFYNVAANYSPDGFAELFRAKAEAMVNDIFGHYAFTSTFVYRLYSVKDFFETNEYLDRKAYCSERTVREIISDKSLYKEGIL